MIKHNDVEHFNEMHVINQQLDENERLISLEIKKKNEGNSPVYALHFESDASFPLNRPSSRNIIRRKIYYSYISLIRDRQNAINETMNSTK